LVFLRSVSVVAGAIDPYLIGCIGFGLNDVLELVLGAGDQYLSYLSPEWPAGEPQVWDPDGEIQIGGLLTEAEVSAAEVALGAVSLPDLADSCTNPAQAGLALRWLSRTPRGLKVTIGPAGLSLGPVLAVAADHRTVLTPAAFISETLIAASARLATHAADNEDSQRTLRAFTCYRVEELLRGPTRTAFPPAKTQWWTPASAPMPGPAISPCS
jgi:hypothetical protein